MIELNKSAVPIRIDLHMHTTISDGTDSPEVLLSRIREEGIALFSITDHDSILSSKVIPPLLREGDPKYLTGVEFSCKDEQGQYHILGYGYQPDDTAIGQVVEKGHGFRVKKLSARLEFLKNEFGFTFPPEELDGLYALNNPGKPHIGNLMVKCGYAETKEQAITQYINQIHVQNAYIRPEEAIEGILSSGGIPVLAHPAFGSGSQLILGTEMEDRLRRLKEYGLQGIEAFYSGFTSELRDEMLSFAEQYGLYVTAGSDYHGTNKTVVLGNTGMDEITGIPRGMESFLHVIEDRLNQ